MLAPSKHTIRFIHCSGDRCSWYDCNWSCTQRSISWGKVRFPPPSCWINQLICFKLTWSDVSWPIPSTPLHLSNSILTCKWKRNLFLMIRSSRESSFSVYSGPLDVVQYKVFVRFELVLHMCTNPQQHLASNQVNSFVPTTHTNQMDTSLSDARHTGWLHGHNMSSG